MQEKISQSLAGRIGMLTLLPFSYAETAKAKIAFPDNLYQQEFTGFYPGIHDRNIPPGAFYRNYVNTYIERDVQVLIHSSNLLQFNRFISLVAGRAGQIVNFQSLASDTGVSLPTVQTWVRILEKGYVVFLLPPYHNNFNKRTIKSPKLYFYDTGLLCYLLNITASDQLATHFAKGAIFENYVLAELLKTRFNKGLDVNMYFWKDNHDKEIDCLLEKQDGPLAIEIRSAATLAPSFMDNVHYWQQLSPSKRPAR